MQIRLKPLVRMSIGMFIISLSFVVAGLIELWLEEEHLFIAWQATLPILPPDSSLPNLIRFDRSHSIFCLDVARSWYLSLVSSSPTARYSLRDTRFLELPH